MHRRLVKHSFVLVFFFFFNIYYFQHCCRNAYITLSDQIQLRLDTNRGLSKYRHYRVSHRLKCIRTFLKNQLFLDLFLSRLIPSSQRITLLVVTHLPSANRKLDFFLLKRFVSTEKSFFKSFFDHCYFIKKKLSLAVIGFGLLNVFRRKLALHENTWRSLFKTLYAVVVFL